jgi:hypothetical protein
VDDERRIQNLVSALQEAGYLVQGELGLDVSAHGRSFRSVVKFQPKESLLSKILSRLTVTIDPGKLIH